MHNAYHMDRKRPAKDKGTGCGKRLLLCQERVKPETSALRAQLSHPPTRIQRGGWCGPLRASSDHRFIVGALRARRALAAPLPSSKLARSLPGMGPD